MGLSMVLTMWVGLMSAAPAGGEARLAGSTQWALSQPATGAQLEGYASATSVQRGEPIDIHVRTDSPRAVRWELYRMGHYGGAGSRRMASGGPVTLGPQPTPVADKTTGLIECRWPVSFTVATQASWPSGVYLLKLVRDDGPQSYVIFVVRADERKNTGVVLIPFTTFQAYNAWGGESLYATSLGLSGGHAKVASFDRPYVDGNGAGEYFYASHHFVLWAESKGYELNYVTNVDLDRDPSLLMGQKLFVSVGHDEYWSRPLKQAVDAALASGVNLAFLGSDTSCWLIRLEAGPTGTSRRRQVCYKDEAPQEDPKAGTNLMTVRWRNARLGEPENGLVGVMSDAWGLIPQPYVVRTPGAWPFAGTGLAQGDSILSVVGYEIDRAWSNGASPPGLVALAESPAISNKGEPNWHTSTLYTVPSGAFVFASGGISWSHGLSHPHFADLRVQRITDNVMRKAGLVPPLAGDTFGADDPKPVDRTGQSAGVSTFAGTAFQEGFVNGPATQARFRRPVGVAVDAQGNVFVADTGNHAVRRIANDAARTVSTIAGTGTPGVGEGAGATTALRSPQSIAIATDGTLYVADTGNHRIVRIARDERWTVSTFAGSKDGRQGKVDGVGTAARFQTPSSVTFAGADLYVADTFNHRLARISPDARVSTLIGARGSGSTNGPASQAKLHRPTGVAFGGGALWVVDTGNRLIRRVAMDAGFTTSTAAGAVTGGFSDGAGSAALFLPMLGAAHVQDRLLVTDTGNERIRAVVSGRARTYAGTGAHGARDGAAEQATFSLPAGIAGLPNGDVLVVDQGASTVRKLLAPAVAGGSRPVPRITGGPFSGTSAPLNVFLDATTSTATGAGRWIQRFRWELGDGATSDAAHLEHRYTRVGRYTVTLTATDDLGASASATQVIQVGPP
ncbi:PKD domain-containing protein [Myxococcus sp. K38C18041901]|uniref:N,N-dimethylformamidase beta subunit family domain-containing protein n=1 Tax=Myxococcus guangdongensis TaxID=2906760 RepID=UPI0020A80184|nr:N,N-dimethylformamidase beta subunit family domain-containing protein [Myxococcus guangdongensis]MCP3063978.1 PKD domain-containing protein [Myxococcus guangdongensis]